MPKQQRKAWILSITTLLLSGRAIVSVYGYRRKPCTRSIRPQFQFPDCYVPDLNPSQLLSSASFLMSHDSATGYLKKGIVSSAISLYAKNQFGTAYDQLNDGARALDLRPKLLQNGTVVFQHGGVTVPVTLEHLVSDAMRWCSENDDELVLLLHSNLKYEFSNATYDGGAAAVSALGSVYSTLGVNYVTCTDVYGLTVQEAMEMAQLSTGGYLLALDQHDFYASFCGKENWIEGKLVTCYPTDNSIPPCISKNSSTFDFLKAYMLASANNDATDDRSVLGPPASLYYYPFNEIQAIWQVDTYSAAAGVAHVSSLIDDNSKSRLNEKLVDMVYNGEFNAISLLAVDNVRLNGNALLSVLRNSCGQSQLEDCGTEISKPKLRQKRMNSISFFVTIMFYLAVFAWIAVLLRHYRVYYQHEKQMQRMKDDMEAVDRQFKTTFGGTCICKDFPEKCSMDVLSSEFA